MRPLLAVVTAFRDQTMPGEMLDEPAFSYGEL
jgi:hypothetical protein